MAGKFEVYKDKKGEFRFRLKAGNGETILASEGYKDKTGAVNGIEAVKKNSDLLARFEKKTSSSGKPYFVLKAANHQIIGNSEMYSSDAACDSGIKSVMHTAPLAGVDDQTA
ncbi:MAG TPA: YegP family protein [Parvularculaceae bacterium]|nr:YegP family protein [Parvularculaceae bacterium]HNS86920.1 YegP family protein [Parvularculaceae bacterium]